ncbi:MAG TPA: methyltransferase [Pyrinomonadaceae bacterium]|nr:methyltransferase [Pyrinomonadaceae bacterium]
MNNNVNAAAPAPDQLPPDAQLMQLVSGAFVSAAVYTAAKLGIADLLAAGPKTAAELAKETEMDESSLYRLLRSLASVGAFEEVELKRFANTPMTETLRSDAPRSTRDLTIWMGEPEHWKVYGELLYSVRTGKPSWDHVHGEPVFPYLFNTNKELGEIFNRAMTSYSHQAIGPLLEAYDFSKAGTVADIAGGYGHLLAAVLAANPNAKGILFDLPAVLKGAPQMMDSHGVSDRVDLVEGDFFSEIPVKADVYMLKHIIHDWYDDNNQKILRNIRANMPDDAKVLIIEVVVPEGNVPHFSKIMDLEMLMSPGGVERTPAEFEQLLSDSGFRLSRIIPTNGLMSIVEAVKA